MAHIAHEGPHHDRSDRPRGHPVLFGVISLAAIVGAVQGGRAMERSGVNPVEAGQRFFEELFHRTPSERANGTVLPEERLTAAPSVQPTAGEAYPGMQSIGQRGGVPAYKITRISRENGRPLEFYFTLEAEPVSGVQIGPDGLTDQQRYNLPPNARVYQTYYPPVRQGN